MLKLKNINKNYITPNYNVAALKSINLNFRNNEFVSILGPSGCGKTTMLNIIGGLDRYTSGDLHINGLSTKEFKDSNWDAYRNHSVGFVFQNYNLISHLNVLNNVELALTLSGISVNERRNKAISVLEKVGLGDQLFKKPNQLSGGQMQRVAIARALINDPEIILADEPTGALDTKTSKQILELLKEVAEDRLVIMVTHNTKLANKYSTRVIKLLDGEVIDDSNPYDGEKIETNKEETIKKTSMSFLTALSLSLKNLFTKKTRTFLTALAGSIGIIGVALILALSSGFQSYIEKMQADTMSNYPLKIEEQAINLNTLSPEHRKVDLEEYPADDKVIINRRSILSNMMITNEITEEYIENVVETIPEELYHSISYKRGIIFNVYKEIEENEITKYVSFNNSSRTFKEMMDNLEFLETQYDVLNKLPNQTLADIVNQKEHLILVVDKYNRISESTLKALGLLTDFDTEKETIDFDDILNSEFKWIPNNLIYPENPNPSLGKFINGNKTPNFVDQTMYDQGLTLKIAAIVRPNKDTQMGAIESTIAYSPALTDYILADSLNSNIVDWMLQEENQTANPFDNKPQVEIQYQKLLKELGGTDKVVEISIYPKDFSTKDLIKEHLDNYNASLENEEDQIHYTDMVEMLISSMNTAIRSITYVLIAFTSISLVVSSLMIGIIIYVSVIERTKEIGILRSIGARKKDISRVFRAESTLIGFSAGSLGILIGFVLTFPINSIIKSKVEGISNIAKLNIMHSLMLIGISILLTLISGAIPSRIAAKKDPVKALRTE